LVLRHQIGKTVKQILDRKRGDVARRKLRSRPQYALLDELKREVVGGTRGRKHQV
jgi:hypothetical protein